MNRSDLFKTLVISLIVTGLFVAGLFVFADWQPPSGTPPNANVLTPINVGSDAQIKAGAFTALTLTASGGEIFANTGVSEHWEGDIKRVDEIIGYNDLRLKGDQNESSPLYIGATTVEVYYSSTGHASFFSGGIEKLRIDSSGNVGIGTTNTTGKLTIFDSTGIPFTIRETDNGNDAVRIYAYTNDSSINLLSGGSTNTKIYSGGSSYFNGGSVGIGTSNPGALLSVGNNTFQVDSSGNLVKINNVSYSWPSAQGGVNTVLTNNASGNLSWLTVSGGISGSGTANYIPKWITSTSLGTSVIYESAGSIGIGTVNPAQKFHVEGSIQIGADSSLMGKRSAGESSVNLIGSNSDDITIGSNSYWDTLIFSVGASGGAIMKSSGEWGIGTLVPLSRLDVRGSVSNIILMLGGTPASDTYLTFRDTGSLTTPRWSLNLDPSYNLIFRDQTANRIAFATGGNVGIGTTTPSTMLNVKKPSAGDTLVRADTYSGNYKAGYEISSAYIDSGSPSTMLYLYPSAYTGNNIFGEAISTHQSILASGITGNVNLKVGTVGTGNLQLYTNSLPRVWVDGSSGNVGIGTTNPASLFSVGNTSQFQVNPSGNLIKINNVSYSWPSTQGGASTVLTNDASGNLSWSAAGGGISGSGTANYVPKWITSTSLGTSVIYESAGSIGIGMQSPTAKLEVSGPTGLFDPPVIKISATTTGAGNAFQIVNTNGSIFEVKGSGTTLINNLPGGDYLLVGNNALSVKSSGNVGIGTSSPNSKLEVVSSINHAYPTPGTTFGSLTLTPDGTNDQSASLTFRANNAGSLATGAQAGIYVQSSSAYGTKMYFGTTNSYATGSQARMTIDQAGNVGIGTTNPAYLFSVGSSSQFGVNSSGIVFLPDGSAGAPTLRFATGGIGIYGSTNGSINFASGGTDRMTIDVNGFVSIGTTDTGSMLVIKGEGASSASSTLRLLNANGVPELFVGDDGYVGIGTISPGNLLHIYTATAGGAKAILETADSLGIYWSIKNVDRAWGIGLSASERFIIRDITGGNIDTFQIYGGAPVNSLVINASGNVGIGVSSPTYQLQLSTNSAAKPTSTAWTVPSDARLKENIRPFTDSLAILRQLNPVSYQLNGLGGMPNGAYGIGLVAQDVKDIIPYTISTFKAKLHPEDTEETELYNFDSSALTFVTINAIKELDSKLAALAGSSADLNLTDTGDLQLTLETTPEGESIFTLINQKTGEVIEKIGTFREIVAAKLKTGFVETKELIVDGVDILKKLTEHETKIQAQQRESGEQRKQIEELKTKGEDLQVEVNRLEEEIKELKSP